jgi:hypothetical protein
LRNLNMKRIIFAFFLWTGIAFSCALGQGRSVLFPDIPGWSRVLNETVYTPDNLWDFIDGAAESYLSFGFVELHMAEYVDAESTDVRVERYRHRTTDDAFGIYAQERNPSYAFIEMGTQGYIEDGVLNFLCGVYYLKITSHVPGPKGLNAMKVVGKQILASLQQPAIWPQAIRHFPQRDKVTNGETYIAENFLGYAFLGKVFIAEYRSKSTYRLFLMHTDSTVSAAKIISEYATAVAKPSLSERKEGETVRIDDPHNGPIFLVRFGSWICGSIGLQEARIADEAFAAIHASILR